MGFRNFFSIVVAEIAMTGARIVTELQKAIATGFCTVAKISTNFERAVEFSIAKELFDKQYLLINTALWLPPRVIWTLRSQLSFLSFLPFDLIKMCETKCLPTKKIKKKLGLFA